MLSRSILVGKLLCWLIYRGGNNYILVFDLAKNNLAQIDTLVHRLITPKSHLQILRMEDSGLGLVVLLRMRTEL